MKKTYWIEKEIIGEDKNKNIYSGNYYVTDGNWRSRIVGNMAEAKKILKNAVWGEGVNSI